MLYLLRTTVSGRKNCRIIQYVMANSNLNVYFFDRSCSYPTNGKSSWWLNKVETLSQIERAHQTPNTAALSFLVVNNLLIIIYRFLPDSHSHSTTQITFDGILCIEVLLNRRIYFCFITNSIVQRWSQFI
jgi:hypothetical protein